MSRHIGAPDYSDTLWTSSVVEASSNVHSRSSSVWTAPSPSQALKFESSRLSSLPKLSDPLSYSHASLSPTPHPRSDCSTYYTALWGSPASPEILHGKHQHLRSFSIVTADGSPSPRLRSNTLQSATLPHGRWISPKAKIERHIGLLGPQRKSAVGVASPLGQRHSRHRFTEDWLKTSLTDTIRTERVHWWSDESDNSDKQSPNLSPIAASPYFKCNWLQLDGEITQPRLLSITEDRPIKGFGGNETEHCFTYSQDLSRSRSERRRRSAIMEDLQEVFQSQPIGGSSTIMLESLSAERQPSQDRTSNRGVHIAEKPLLPRPPQFDRTVSEAPLPAPIKTSIAAQPSFQRARKRVVWRGKACIIALPAGDEHWNRDSHESFLKPQEVKDRLEAWESKGYQTRGFKLSSAVHSHLLCSSDGQSRTIYPGPEDEELERTDGNFRVSIPDRREWEDYVNDLKEDKLRALGVSFAEDESSRRDSPALSLMSRHASSQSSAMPISPSLATLSNISTHNSQHLNRFSVHFTGPTSSGSHASMIHNVSQPQAKATVSHFSRYSMPPSTMEQGLPSTCQFPPAQSPLGSWSPQQYFKSHPSSRVTSPAVNGQMQSFGSALSTLALSASDHGNQAPNDLLPQMRQQQTQIQTQLLQHQHQQLLHPRLLQKTTNVRNQVEPSKLPEYEKQPDIMTPIPLGHRQNLSETLQKEVDEAEMHMQNSKRITNGDTDKDLESDIEDKGSHVDELPVLANILRDVGSDFNSDDSDLDTNPSLSGSPKPASIPSGNNHRSHTSKSSLSKLNVNAPEFVYEPKNPFAPEVFAFLGNQPHPQPSASTLRLASITGNPESAAKLSLKSTTLNVAAPSFTPAIVPKPIVPSRVFSFSSSGPSFKSEAPSYKPNGTSATTTDQTVASNEQSGRKIFGDINLSEIVKPARKSRAIPIIKPRDTQDGNDQDLDGQEDESGRITQADGRQKRMRRGDGDGDGDSDQISLFVTPGCEVLSQVENITPPEKDESQNSGTGIQENKTTLETAANQLKEIIDDLPGSDVSSLMGSHEALDADSKPWGPFSFSDAKDAAIFNPARSILPSLGQSSGDDAQRITKVEKAILRVHSDQALISPRISSEDHVHGISSALRNVEIDSLPASTDILEFQKSRSGSELSPSTAANELPSPRRKASSGSSHTGSHSPAFIGYQYKPAEKLREEAQHAEAQKPFSAGPADDVSYLEQSYNEIDAVMKHLNDEDSDLGVERNVGPWRNRSSVRTPLALLHDTSRVHHLLPVPHARSAAPSPGPNRLQQPFQYLPKSDSESASTAEVELVARNARFSPSYRPSKASVNSDHPIHRLNSPSNLPVSDWDDVVSSADEAKLLSRTGFFDHRINDLVGGVVQQRLNPLEKSLASIQDSLVALTSRSASRRHRSSTSAEVEHSDADDEDDPEAPQSKVKSPTRDRKYDKIKSSIAEITAAQQNFASVGEVSEILEVVKDLKASMHRSSPPSGDIKTVVEEAVAKQLRGRSKPITSSHESATVEKNQLQIAGLESMLKIADARADDELKARRATEDALADSQRLLRMAMQEAAEQRESAEETERSLSKFHDERLHVLRRTAMLEGAQESLQKTASDLNEKNAALEDTLEEYRLSRSQWREEVEEAKMENKDLQNTITALKVEIEDGIRGRQTLRTKFDRLQEDMTLASRDIARDQSIWRKREEENKARLESLAARLEAESSTREKLEHEIMGFLAQEKEVAGLRHCFEQSQQDNARLSRLVSELRVESQEHQKSITRYECELHDARESAKLEVHRIRSVMEADIEIANNQVITVRSNLERDNSRLQSDLDELTTHLASNKAKHEVMLKEASESRNTALKDAAEGREAALQEHYRFHERTLEVSKAKSERELKNALEDKQRSEIFLNDRLALADEKVRHLEERAAHLEEKLEIAKAAAQQLAAQSKRFGSSPSASQAATLGRGSDIPEKISPQALRESIMVLQEQLQEREGRIEQLEQQFLETDKDAPAKLKDQEIEIAWLRELLGVRVDDLEDIIATLSQPSYDRETVKDAAIRLKANLQMEQQEKERALAGGQTFPSRVSISTLTSSPRALPLAAVAAWGNWRKARDTSFGSLSEIASGSPSQTPSRSSSSAQGFLSGLLTPPDTKIRHTPQPDPSTRPSGMTSAASKRSTGAYRTPRQSISLREESRPLRPLQPPATPPMMREASYDGDAESMGFGEDRSDGDYQLSEVKAGDKLSESSTKTFPKAV